MMLPKMAKVEAGDIVRIRQTVEDNGKLAGQHGIVVDAWDSEFASQKQIVVVDVLETAVVNTPSGPMVGVTNKVIERGQVFSREQLRPLQRVDGNGVAHQFG